MKYLPHSLLLFLSLNMLSLNTYAISETGDVDLLKTNIINMVESEFTRLSVPGVSVAVVLDSGDEITAFKGTANTETKEELNEDHQFRLASVSKHLTAIMLMLLQEQGDIALDDKIINHVDLPDFPNRDIITIRQLMNHTAGVYDHVNSPNDYFSIALSEPNRVWTPEEVLNYTVQAGADFQPGAAYSYSNTGYYILGLLIEAVTEQTFAEAFNDLLVNPLSLTGIFADDYSDTNTPIEMFAANNRAYEYHKSSIGAAGNFVAKPLALAKLGQQVYAGNFISDESEAAMSTGSDLNNAYGLGSRLWSLQNIFHFGHTGTLGGYKSIYMYIPEYEVSIAVIVNGYPAVSDNWWHFLDEVMLEVVSYYKGTLETGGESTDETPTEEPVEDEDDNEEDDKDSGGSTSLLLLLISSVAVLLRRRKTLN
ncbi:serine hydrolase domain-containing protein [Psychrosphaera aquimarina]|uniref:Serine hydrolase domain-containing protein n=1 Tax=Psychrosphaera aquimarina TaxID=2044854 RepID=A0ABU3R0K9_9GAMM|nr:serine hydrolase domain-containing protein [Psychrosphaera aquimarina]MDU0113218.1 serine hydrolase domain-containing protein [Psychrosphaera aquimarina]